MKILSRLKASINITVFLLSCNISASFFENIIKKPLFTASCIAVPASVLAYKIWSDHKKFQSLCQDMGDVFMLGEKSFCDLCPPNGLTREQWYMQKLSEQENYLRNKIISMLQITPEEYSHYEKLAKTDLLRQEDTFESQDLRGLWMFDLKQRREVRSCQPDADNSFSITDKDIELAESILRGYGYTGKIVYSENSGEEAAAIAYHNSIKIFPVLLACYGGGPENMLLGLRHELSHIQHGDILFEKTIQKYVESNFIKQDGGQYFVNQEALEAKGLTPVQLENARKLLQQTWFNFHERRADTEAFLAIKNHDIFKKAIADKDQFSGFPFAYEMITGYQQSAKIPFLKDFCKGIQNDSKQNS